MNTKSRNFILMFRFVFGCTNFLTILYKTFTFFKTFIFFFLHTCTLSEFLDFAFIYLLNKGRGIIECTSYIMSISLF